MSLPIKSNGRKLAVDFVDAVGRIRENVVIASGLWGEIREKHEDQVEWIYSKFKELGTSTAILHSLDRVYNGKDIPELLCDCSKVAKAVSKTMSLSQQLKYYKEKKSLKVYTPGEESGHRLMTIVEICDVAEIKKMVFVGNNFNETLADQRNALVGIGLKLESRIFNNDKGYVITRGAVQFTETGNRFSIQDLLNIVNEAMVDTKKYY